MTSHTRYTNSTTKKLIVSAMTRMFHNGLFCLLCTRVPRKPLQATECHDGLSRRNMDPAQRT